MSPEHCNPSAELEERLRFETLIADLSSKFINLPPGEVDREIMDAERRICELLGLDISALWQLSGEALDFFTVTHYYSVQEGPQPPGRVKVEDFPWFLQQLLAGRIVAISSLEELPPEAAHDREVCRQLGVKSNLTIPLSVGGQRPFGALGLNTTLAQRDWTEELVKRLQLLAQVFANALARKRADQAVRQSEARLAAGAELAGLGYYEIDYAKRTSFIDDRFREICGVPPDRRQGLDPVQFWMEHVHPSDLQLLLDERQKLHDGRIDRISAEYRYLHPDLGEKWIHHLARIAERSAAGGAVRIFGVLRDITPQKQAEAELLRQRTELAHIARVSTMGELAASLAHELNQPLGAILANAETAEFLLEQDTLALEEMRPVVTAIRKDGERAGEVIRRMRGLFGKHELKLELLDLNSLVHDVQQLVSRDLALRGISLSVALAPGLPEISGDRTHLQQVVLNLIVNAMDALAGQPRERRHIRVSTCPTTDCQVEMAVTDSGPGIEPDTLPRVFQPFYTTKPDGMGMGLSIARTIIDAHCGRIWAENITTGGAAFRVALPASGKGQVARPGPVGLPPRSTRSPAP
jgi:PAS domain S-box-containing protein